MSDLDNFFGELRRRSIWQVLGVYLAGSWVALQVVDTIVESASLPTWLPGMALVFLVIGLPVVLATAFVQESGAVGEGDAPAQSVTTGTNPARESASGLARVLTWKMAVGGGVAAFTMWGMVATVLLFRGDARPGAVDGGERVAIAALPFASAGAGDDDESFALGLHDDLLTQLSRIGSMRVISRTSVMRYKDNPGNLREIARELGAHVILEGSVQRSGNQIHLNAQLIDTREEEGHLWAESFDRALTVENIFVIQRELAGRIAEATHATLTPQESEEVGRAPTENLEAYTIYLQANNYFASGPRSPDFDIALDLYRKAVEEDPAFSQAYARLALALASKAEVTREGGTELLEDARREALLALALDPENPEAHLALGQYHYSAFRDYEAALNEISAARRAGLNSAEVHHNLGAIQRRQGNFDAGVASFEEAVRLNPLSGHYLEDLASTYHGAGRLSDAVVTFRRGITLQPDLATLYSGLFQTALFSMGDVELAREAAREMEATGSVPIWVRASLAWYDRDFAAIDELGTEVGQGMRLRALERTEGPAAARSGWLDEVAASRHRLAEVRAPQEIRPPNREASLLAELAYALAAAGEEDEARDIVAEALALLPVTRDAMDGPDLLVGAASVYVRLDQPDEAVRLLTEVLAGTNGFTPEALAVDPEWDPIRSHPGFIAMTRPSSGRDTSSSPDQ